MPLPLFSIHSERGGSHSENEDVALAQAHPRDESLLISILADGQGGRSGGAFAAHTASAAVLSQVSALAPARLRNPITRQRTWLVALTGADDAVSETTSDGFTTLIGLCVGANFVAGASCGDSGVLLVRNASGGEAEWLTKNQRKNPPVGSGAAHPVAFSARLRPGDMLLVMSDGVFRYVGEDALIKACRDNDGPETIANALRELQTAQSRSGALSDDFSVVVITPPPRPPPRSGEGETNTTVQCKNEKLANLHNVAHFVSPSPLRGGGRGEGFTNPDEPQTTASRRAHTT